MSDRRARVTAGVLALIGAAALVAGTVLHPSQADPQVSADAFAEYAATGRAEWVVSHVLQLAGVVAMFTAVVILAGLALGGAWPRVLTALAGASMAVAAVLQAVDGVALKATVDLWAAAAPDGKAALFDAALAVRQVEIGLDAMLALISGTAIIAYACAFLPRPGAWGRILAILALAAGVAFLIDGWLLAVDGYSARAMLATTVSGVLTLVWMVPLGIRSLVTHGDAHAA
jgi:hypothetical protein